MTALPKIPAGDGWRLLDAGSAWGTWYLRPAGPWVCSAVASDGPSSPLPHFMVAAEAKGLDAPALLETFGMVGAVEAEPSKDLRYFWLPTGEVTP